MVRRAGKGTCSREGFAVRGALGSFICAEESYALQLRLTVRYHTQGRPGSTSRQNPAQQGAASEKRRSGFGACQQWCDPQYPRVPARLRQADRWRQSSPSGHRGQSSRTTGRSAFACPGRGTGSGRVISAIRVDCGQRICGTILRPLGLESLIRK